MAEEPSTFLADLLELAARGDNFALKMLRDAALEKIEAGEPLPDELCAFAAGPSAIPRNETPRTRGSPPRLPGEALRQHARDVNIACQVQFELDIEPLMRAADELPRKEEPPSPIVPSRAERASGTGRQPSKTERDIAMASAEKRAIERLKEVENTPRRRKRTARPQRGKQDIYKLVAQRHHLSWRTVEGIYLRYRDRIAEWR